MANTNSDITTGQAAAMRDRTLAPASPANYGLLYVIRGQVTCPATPTVSDTLTLVPAELIPEGACYAPEESWVYPETAPGTALTLDVGYSSNADALADALALTTAGTTGGKVNFDKSGTLPAGLADPLPTVKEDIIATVTVSTSVDATVIQFAIAFRLTA
jgi:hypothetical protein